MTMNEFVDWAQSKMDTCNVYNEIEASKMIVEILKKFHSVGEKEKEVSEAN